MEKILLAIDGINLNKKALEFACYLARLTKSKVTGIFLENGVSEQRPIVKQMYETTALGWELDEIPVHKTKTGCIENNIALFKEGCTAREVNHSLHRDRGLPAKELIGESRFADLLVLDPETSFNDRFEEVPSEFVKDILRKTECPVIIAPEDFAAIDEILFLYDGSASCVFAIKQFTYLFPQFARKKACILNVNHTGDWLDTHKHKFSELLKSHYGDIKFEILKGHTDTLFLETVVARKNTFVVMGAYGRNTVSMFFKSSHADMLIKTGLQPIFIAHL